MICPKCNNENSNKAMYCMYCANKIGRTYNVEDNVEKIESIVTAIMINQRVKVRKLRIQTMLLILR